MKFEALLESNGKTATGFEVPEEIVTALGGSKRAKVAVTINGYTYRNSVAPMGGRYLVGVSAENRANAGVSAGDRLDVELELDTAPRVVEVPEDLAAAPCRHPGGPAFLRHAVLQPAAVLRPARHPGEAAGGPAASDRAGRRAAGGGKEALIQPA